MNYFYVGILFYVISLIIIFLGQFFSNLNYFGLSIILFFVLSFFIFKFINSEKYKNIYLYVGVIIFGILISFFRLGFTYKKFEKNHISNFLNFENKINIEGKICDEVDVRSHNVKYTICTEKICFKKGELNICQNVYGKILVNSNRYPRYEYSDKVLVFGKLITPPEDDEFSYKKYLERNDIYGFSTFVSITKISDSKNKSDYFFYKIYELKFFFLNRISMIFPEPHGNFLAGILIGARRGLPDEITEDFKRNGLAHLVAISGYNITLIILIVFYIFGFLGRNLSYYITSFFIIIFTIITGASSAVLRASVMGILNLIALKFGRSNSILNLTLLTASSMSIFNPKILWWDLGFQLSFLSLIGVIWLSPIFFNLFKKISDILGFKEILVLTLSASIMTFPVISYNTGMISIVSPIANLFVAPLIPFAMFFGFLSIIFPFSFFENFFGFTTYSFLDLALRFSSFFAGLKYSVLNIKISGVLTLLFIFLLFLFILLVNLINKKYEKIST